MNIEETIQSMEAKNILVSLDIGEHARCNIDSNCPIAIQLRRIILESAITLPELLAGYNAITAPDLLSSDSRRKFVTDSKASINLMGKHIEIDLDDIINSEIGQELKNKTAKAIQYQEQVANYAKALHGAYLNEIAQQRKVTHLPQFKAPIQELIKYGVSITSENNNYIFLFKEKYSPEYLVDNGIRYQISLKDMQVIYHDPVYLKIVVNPAGSIIELVLLDHDGKKFQHYHGGRSGTGSDCWGSINFNETKRSLSLLNVHHIRTVAMGSLHTINMNSLMNHEVPGWPTSNQLKDRSTKLGQEGQMSQQASTPISRWNRGTMIENEAPEPVGTVRRNGWGARI